MTLSEKRTGRIAGLLFLLPLLAYGAGTALINQQTAQPDFPQQLSGNETSFLVGILLLFVNSATVVGIGAVLFPVLQQRSATVALAYFATRLVEALLLLVGAVSLLLLLAIGREAPHDALAATLAVKGNYYAYQLAMIALGWGSLFFCALLFRAKLVPPALAVWGWIGYALLLAGAALELFGWPVGVLLALPGGLFELFFAGWLLFKGFRPVAPL